MDPVRFKQLMKARGHWRDAELTSAEPALRDERGIVTLIEKNTGYYHASDNVIEVASIGFPIAVILILIIFKKIR